MKFSFTQNLFDMNVEKAAIDYKETKQDKDFLILYEFADKLASIIARKYNTTKDADIIQNCGVKLIEKIHQFNPEKSHFYNWCYTIIANEYKVKFRKNNRMSVDVEVEDIDYDYSGRIKAKQVQSYEPDYFPEDKLTEEDIEAVLDTFDVIYNSDTRGEKYLDPKIMKEIFYKYILDGDNAVKLSKEYNISIGRVKLIIYRYRRYFIDFLRSVYPNKVFPVQIYGNAKVYKRSCKK